MTISKCPPRSLTTSFRELAITYLERHDLEQVAPEDLRGDSVKQDPEATDEEELVDPTGPHLHIDQPWSYSRLVARGGNGTGPKRRRKREGRP